MATVLFCQSSKMYSMKTLTVAVQATAANPPWFAPLIKAAVIKAARTVFNPWNIALAGVFLAGFGLLRLSEPLFTGGLVVSCLGLCAGLTREFYDALKGGVK